VSVCERRRKQSGEIRRGTSVMSELIFKNYGGSFQLKIRDAQDLEKIEALDEALWAATSIPVELLNCDPAFASFVDTDKNSRIRTDELKAALAWLFRLLKNRSRLSEGSSLLRLDDIDTSCPEGKKLRQAAEQILANLGTPQAGQISLTQVRDLQKIRASSAHNGDGIIAPDAVEDADLSRFIRSVMETVGTSPDASGKPGIGAEELARFLKESEAYLSWRAKGEIPGGQSSTEIMPWAADTPAAYELVAGLEGKIDQYFIQCAMVGFDERTADGMRLRQKELEETDFSDTAGMKARLESAPLAPPNSERILDFEGAINPLYGEQLSLLREKVLNRALGEPVRRLSKDAWDKVKGIFAPHRAWLQSKEGITVEKLGLETLTAYIKGPYRKRVEKLISEDLAVADDLQQVQNLEKLILYQRWLMELANNFVSFANLYNPEVRSLFEAGTLIIGGRKLTFTLRIKDRQAHKKIAAQSHMHLLYVEVAGRRNGDVKFEIVAAVTSTNASGLHIGKRGIFFTRDGVEWDARVVDIVENPISIWESLKAPFRRLVDLIKRQIEKFTKARQAKVEAAVAAPGASGIARDLMLGGGIAIAALGASLAYITKALSEIKTVHILAVLGGIVVIILVPSAISGLAKLRRRNMSALLEASGCAVNVLMRLSLNLGRLFTRVPKLPEGSRSERKDALAQFVKNFGYRSFSVKRLARTALISAAVFLAAALLLIGFYYIRAILARQ